MNWCIEATRVVTCIARQFNLRAIPIQVATIVTNAVAVQECGIATPLREYPEQRPFIVHSGVARDDRDHGPDGVNSHVVAMVSGTYVVDLAVAQFRERAEGVFTPDVWAMHAPELELEFGDLAASIFTEEGQNTGRDGGQETMLVYQRRPLSIDLRTVAARTSSTPRAMARSMTRASEIASVTECSRTQRCCGHFAHALPVGQRRTGSSTQVAASSNTSRVLTMRPQRSMRSRRVSDENER